MNPINVLCIAQERWFIRRQQCQCGDHYDEEIQHALTSSTAGPIDETKAHCPACGKGKTFQFDISACAAHLQPNWTKKLEAYSKVMPEAKAARLVLVPEMERVLGFIADCQRECNRLGLEFMAEAVAHAQEAIATD
jgi:hypothetical protein